jgi:hypothetical protein
LAVVVRRGLPRGGAIASEARIALAAWWSQEGAVSALTTNTATDPRWRDLYRAAGVAAIVSEIVIILGLVSYFIWPYAPGTQSTETIFRNLQNNTLGALISLDLFLFIGNLFSILLFLAFYVSLRRVNESYALIALAVGLVAVVLLVHARPLIELYSLSGQYAAATTEAAKSQYLAAGAALLASFDGVGWFLNTLLGGLSLLVSSILMLRSDVYSKTTAYVGIVSNVAVCCFFIPAIGIFLLFLSVVGYAIWYFMLARRFLKLGRGG